MTKLVQQINNKYIFNHNCRIISVRASNRYKAQIRLSNQLKRNN